MGRKESRWRSGSKYGHFLVSSCEISAGYQRWNPTTSAVPSPNLSRKSPRVSRPANQALAEIICRMEFTCYIHLFETTTKKILPKNWRKSCENSEIYLEFHLAFSAKVIFHVVLLRGKNLELDRYPKKVW